MTLLIIWRRRYDFDVGQRQYKANWKGRAPKIETCLGPEIARVTARAIWPQKRFSGPAPSYCPSYVFAPHRNQKGQAPLKKQVQW